MALLCGDGERLVAVMELFIDESGTNPETPVLGVAGCYGNHEQWAMFKDIWKPHSKGFHARHSSQSFHVLVEAMEKANIQTVLVSVAKQVYKEYASAHLKTAIGNAYAACAMLCATQVCQRIEPTKASIVLEAGQPNLEFVRKTLEYLMDWEEFPIAAIAKAKKEDFIELHSADFVSHICSSYDKPWMSRLFDLKLLQHLHLTKGDLESAAPHATMLFTKSRAVRRALKNMRAKPSEFENFHRTMERLIKVPHSEIQAALEAEKAKKMIRKEIRNDSRDKNDDSTK